VHILTLYHVNVISHHKNLIANDERNHDSNNLIFRFEEIVERDEKQSCSEKIAYQGFHRSI